MNVLLKTGAFVALILVAYLPAAAQKNSPPVNEPDLRKPKIFADLPEKVALRLTDAQALLNLPVGAAVNAVVATGLPLVGTVVSRSNPADKAVQSVVIRSKTRGGAVFTFTRTQNADGSFSFIGRMLDKNGGDALEIVREDSGYVLRKKGYYDVINE